MEFRKVELESIIFEYFEKIRQLISPQIWENILLDCSKNEVFLILLLYQKEQVNMTQAAQYLNVPLNTATGIVARMERKKLVCRERSPEDKRVVTIHMTEAGKNYMQNLLQEVLHYGQIIFRSLSPEELQSGIQILNKVMEAFDSEFSQNQMHKKSNKVRKITIS